MKKIDIHLHVRMEQTDRDGKAQMDSAENMLAHLDALGIEKGVVLSGGEDPEGNLLCTNAEACAIHKKYPDRYEFMCNISEMAPEDVRGLLERYQAEGAVGVGELTINRRIDDALLEALFDAAGDLKLPVTFHMSPEVGYSYGIVDDPGLPLLEQALQKYPDTIFMAHSPTFWIEISKDAPQKKEERNAWGSGPVVPGGRVPELFSRYGNLYGDLSANSAGQAVMRDEEFGLAFLEQYCDRLLFATDMVNTEMVFPLGQWLDDMAASGRLSEGAYRKIVRENAERIYSIK